MPRSRSGSSSSTPTSPSTRTRQRRQRDHQASGQGIYTGTFLVNPDPNASATVSWPVTQVQNPPPVMIFPPGTTMEELQEAIREETEHRDMIVSRANGHLPYRLAVTSTFEIAAAHHLPHHHGKCRRPHGHNYRLEFTRYGRPEHLTKDIIEGEYSSSEGMLIDFGDFDDAIKAVLETLDHHDLNEIMTNPTAERLACYLLDALPGVHKVIVWETGRHCATAERLDELG